MLKVFNNDLFVCGIDEAGRGSLAGPVTAAAVILPKNYINNEIRDSKKIIQKMESSISKKDSDLIEKSLKEFWKKGYQYGVGESGEAVETINTLRGQFASRNEQIIKEAKYYANIT